MKTNCEGIHQRWNCSLKITLLCDIWLKTWNSLFKRHTHTHTHFHYRIALLKFSGIFFAFIDLTLNRLTSISNKCFAKNFLVFVVVVAIARRCCCCYCALLCIVQIILLLRFWNPKSSVDRAFNKNKNIISRNEHKVNRNIYPGHHFCGLKTGLFVPTYCTFCNHIKQI